MAKRFMISPITGIGTEPNPFRASVSDVTPAPAVNQIIPSDTSGTPQSNPHYGKPKYNFALCNVGTNNLPAVLAVSNSYVFPDYPLDATLAGMEVETRAAMVQSVQAYDLDGNGLHFDCPNGDEDSYRSLILSLAQQLEPAFANLNTFDVGEPS